MSSPWHSIPPSFPPTATTLWVRRTTWWATPFKATFDAITQTFTVLGAAYTLPWWTISRWRLA
jgi:hypothetical protein